MILAGTIDANKVSDLRIGTPAIGLQSAFYYRYYYYYSLQTIVGERGSS